MSGRYRRGRRRTWNSGFRRSRSYSTMRSSMAKRSRGNLKAANNQNDTSDVVINLMKSVDVGVSTGFTWDANINDYKYVNQGVMALNVYDLLRKSDFYNSYANMYDQFRITSINVKVTPTRWSSFDQQLSTNNINLPSNTFALGTLNSAMNLTYIFNPHWYSEVEIPDPQNDGQTMVIRVRNPQWQQNFNPEDINASQPLYLAMDPITKEPILPKVTGSSDDEPPQVIYNYEENDGGNYRNLERDMTVIDEWPGTWLNRNKQYPATVTDLSKLSYIYGEEIGLSQGLISKDVTIGVQDQNTGFEFPQAFTVVTAWDRTGLDEVQLADIEGGWLVNDIAIGSNQVAIPNGLPYLIDGVATNNFNNVQNRVYKVVSIGDDLSSYSSAKTTQLVPGSKFTCTRYLYPSSNQEKSIYYSTSSLRKQFNYQSFNDLPYLLDTDLGMGQAKTEIIHNQGQPDQYSEFVVKKESDIKSSELCNLLSDPSIPFKPTFLIGVLGFNKKHQQKNGNGNGIVFNNYIKRITFNLEFDIGVTFRGLRKSQVV